MIERFFASLSSGLRLRDLSRRILASDSSRLNLETAFIAGVLAVAAVVRLTALLTYGYNSDEAVYAGQAAALARAPVLSDLFPIFRAHPLLFQFLLSLFFHFGVNEIAGRLLAALSGILTVYLVYRLGAELYSRPAGTIAAVFLALMPYHVVVTRQALLDGPMTMFATVALLFLARYGRSQKPFDLYASGAALGLTVLTKETGILYLASAYAFFALSPGVKLRLRDVLISGGLAAGLIALYPLTAILAGAGASTTARQYLVWQFLRFPNHTAGFYLSTVPFEIGPLVVFLALLGLWILRQERSWKETLLLAWIAIPVLFFQLWPTKGYQYLLPIAPPAAVLAGRAMVGLFPPPGDPARPRSRLSRFLLPAAFAVVAFSLLVPTGLVVFPRPVSQSLAGAGGVAGGREAGLWLRDNLPAGSNLMTIGPSMANILQFYGRHRAFGLSVSANPLYRNPAYTSIDNPDLQIRLGEIQYLIWDAYSANRSEFFAESLMEYVQKYNGRVVHSETIPILTEGGAVIAEPVIIIYRVYP